MRLYVAAPLTIIAGVGVVLSVIAWLAVSRSAETVQWTKQKEMTRVAGLVNDVLRSATRNAVSQAELVAGMPGVGAAMAREDRDWLKSVLPVFQQQRAKYGVEGVTFITPPAKTLLRLADPGRFGDDQSASRPLLLAASRLRESQGGVEISRTSIGLRGVAPAYDNGRAVGLVNGASACSASPAR